MRALPEVIALPSFGELARRLVAAALRMGSREGAIKNAARRAGVSAEEWEARRAAGLKWCWACERWHPVDAFGRARHRYDGRSPACLESRRAADRARRER